ncbi:MAG: hypothetical protein PHU31_08380 [Anaerotignum sp.]|nr:hypothetical protein [Anaerotignum sp.]
MYHNPNLPDPFNARTCGHTAAPRHQPMPACGQKPVAKPICNEPKIYTKNPVCNQAPVLEKACPPKTATETCEKNCRPEQIDRNLCNASNCNQNQLPVLLLLLCLYR